MKRHYFYPALLVSLTFILFGCGLGDATEKAEKQAAKFHKFMKAKNENAMLDMMHEDAMAQDGDNIRKFIHQLATESNISKVEKSSGFNTSIENGVTTVRLNYVLHDKSSGKITEELTLRDSKDGVLKILAMSFKKRG